MKYRIHNQLSIKAGKTKQAVAKDMHHVILKTNFKTSDG
jgi:hypothetical protein